MKLNMAFIGILVFLITFANIANAQESLSPIKLPIPQTDGGKPLMQVLKERKTSREFGVEKLSPQMLSNLLWAACGINRSDSEKRTAPSAKNNQEIDIYVAMAEGLYLYDAKAHSLMPIFAKDIREMTGTQGFVKEVPVNLIYVANFSKMSGNNEADKILYSAADTGFISENVYLFCTSEGLATVVRGAIDKPALSKAMNLKPEQKIILAQSVGYPKK